MRLPIACGVSAVALAALAGGAPPAVTAATNSCAAQPWRFGPASRPFAPSHQLPSVQHARSRIGFEPRLPSGRPFRIYVSRESELRQRRIGLSFRQSAVRWFILTEQRAASSKARFEASIREIGARNECRDAANLRLRDGSLALLTNARDRRVLRFRTAGIDILLMASPRSASTERLVAVANALITS